MREDMPTLRGRWFNVALCCDCWNRLNPDRAMEPERQRSIEALIVKTFADAEKDAIRDNCCAACEEVPHAGIYVRTTVEALRKMRPT
jgi:hypothetical protein